MPTPEDYLASVLAVCTPEMPKEGDFNPKAKIPYGVTTEHVRKAMVEFVNFLGFIDTQLVASPTAPSSGSAIPHPGLC